MAIRPHIAPVRWATWLIALAFSQANAGQASTQILSDVRICMHEMERDKSNEERIGAMRNGFASLSWDARKPDRADILRASLFLEKMQGDRPDTWAGAMAFAELLSEVSAQSEEFIYALNYGPPESAILIRENSVGELECRLVTNDDVMAMLKDEYPHIEITTESHRRVTKVHTDRLRIFASAIKADLASALGIPFGYSATMTVAEQVEWR